MKIAVRESRTMTRRTMLGTLGVIAVTAASGTLTPPRRAGAQPLGLNESLDEAMKRVFGSRSIKDGGSLIKLDIPLIAENGYVVADKNRIPVVTRVTLTPAAGQAFMGANIRLGETGDVRAIVEQSDGTLWQVKREVKVTVGGCGG